MADGAVGRSISIVVSLVALGLSGLSAWVSMTGLARTRDTMLLQQRVEACAALDHAAERISSAYRAASIVGPNAPNEERFRLSQAVASAITDLRGRQTLALIGPEALAEAEQNLISAAKPVGDITGNFTPGPTYSPESVDARLQAAWADTAAHDSAMRNFFSARTHLHTTCRTTLGVYRTSAPTE